MQSSKSAGNVLFLILLAVVLFAALSYAVTQSTRGSGKDGSAEKTHLAVSAIQQYVSLLRNELQRLTLVEGCELDNIDWRTDHYKRIDGSPLVGILHAPLHPKPGCAVFNDYGGRVAPVDFAQYANSGYVAHTASTGTDGRGGHILFGYLNRPEVGSSANEIGMIVAGMDYATCAELVNPITKPTGTIEIFEFSYDPDLGDPGPYSGTNGWIDEPANLNQEYFADFNFLSWDQGTTACRVGTVLLPR